MHAEFIRSIKGTDPITNDGHPQVVFLGRSNVGKSSVINSLLSVRKLVRSSSTPGQTRMINFFLVDESFYLVDLPGYGYAKMPLTEREKLAKMMQWYLLDSGADIQVVVLIIDAQVGFRAIDREVLEAFREKPYRIIILANKADRLTQKERAEASKKIGEELEGNGEAIFYSAKTGKGREQVWDLLTKK